MTDLERVSYLRRRLIVWNSVGICLLFLAYVLRRVIFPELTGLRVAALLAVPVILIGGGVAYSILLIRLQKRLKSCGDELAMSNMGKATRYAFIASLVGILPLMLLSSVFDWSSQITLMGMEVLMLLSLAVSWLLVEHRQNREMLHHD